MIDPNARSARRRGGPKERPVAEPVEVPVVEPEPSPVAVRAPRPVVVAPAPPTHRDATDFEGLRAIGDMDKADFKALMDQFGGERRSGGFRVGQRVRGRVTSVGQQHLFLDLGGKADASLDRLEMGEVTIGEVIDAFVLSTDGEVRLTRTPSGGAAREMLAEAQTAKLPVNGKIAAVAEAGWQVLLADGIKAFCPASHTGTMDAAEPTLVGQSFPFLVHDVRGRDVVVSRRALVEAEERAQSAARIGALSVNDVVEGTVSSVREFGAFVKLPGGVEGMVHISNLADRRVKHPSEVVKEGDVVQVRVLEVDAARRRVSLGMRQAVELSAGGGSSSASGGGAGTGTGSTPSSRGFSVFASLLQGVKVKK